MEYYLQGCKYAVNLPDAMVFGYRFFYQCIVYLKMKWTSFRTSIKVFNYMIDLIYFSSGLASQITSVSENKV